MMEMIVGALVLVGGAALLLWVYSRVVMEKPEEREAREARKKPFAGFERREPTRMTRRMSEAELQAEAERRATEGRRVTDPQK